MQGEPRYLLFVGDDWAEDHHDVEIQDETGRKLAARRLPEGAAGIARLHELIAAHLAEDGDPARWWWGSRPTGDCGCRRWPRPGYQVFGLNPRQVARFKERYSLRAKKDDAADAHALADMVRAERHQLRAVAADTAGAQAVKVAARAHQTLIWERTRHTLRLRSALREFFPAALAAYADLGLTGADTLELLTRAPDPGSRGETDRRPDQRRAQAGPPPRRGRQSPGDQRRAARPATGPARRRHRRLRRHRAGLRQRC